MALIRCSGCGKDVSTHDATCSCGASIQTQISAGERASTGGLVKVAIGVAVIGAGAWFALRGPSQESKDQAFLTEQQESVRRTLKDPQSAQFSEVYISRIAGTPSACGYVNAKNSFGGYVGRRRFMAENGRVFVEDSDDDKAFNLLWPLRCG